MSGFIIIIIYLFYKMVELVGGGSVYKQPIHVMLHRPSSKTFTELTPRQIQSISFIVLLCLLYQPGSGTPCTRDLKERIAKLAKLRLVTWANIL